MDLLIVLLDLHPESLRAHGSVRVDLPQPVVLHGVELLPRVLEVVQRAVVRVARPALASVARAERLGRKCGRKVRDVFLDAPEALPFPTPAYEELKELMVSDVTRTRAYICPYCIEYQCSNCVTRSTLDCAICASMSCTMRFCSACRSY